MDFSSNPTCVNWWPGVGRAAYGSTCVLSITLLGSFALTSQVCSRGVLCSPELSQGGLALSLTSLLVVTDWPPCAPHRTGGRGTAGWVGVGPQVSHGEKGAVEEGGLFWSSPPHLPPSPPRPGAVQLPGNSSRLQAVGAEALCIPQ